MLLGNPALLVGLGFEEFIKEESSGLGTHSSPNYFLSQDGVDQVWVSERHGVDVDEFKGRKLLPSNFLILHNSPNDLESCGGLSGTRHTRDVKRRA